MGPLKKLAHLANLLAAKKCNLFPTQLCARELLGNENLILQDRNDY